MEKTKNDIAFNFFRPTTDYSRRNRNIIITTILVWFISIFGFQVLLVVLQKPTPEEGLMKYTSALDNVKSNSAGIAEKQDFLRSMVNVAGKSSVRKADRMILNKGISWLVYNQLTDTQRVSLSVLVGELKLTREGLVTASGEEYVAIQSNLESTKAAIISLTRPVTGDEPGDHREAILPYSLNSDGTELTEEEWTSLTGVMKFYTTHNQSILTDTRFLGFPLHYFYTGEFLLILFVALSLIYSMRITRLQKVYGIVE